MEKAKDAIDALREEFKRIPTNAIRAMDTLKGLPSAQPDVPDTNVGDMISRQAAIIAVKKHELVDLDENRRWYNHGLLDAEVAILDLPSAQPERKKGHWKLDFAHNKMTCSECGRTFDGGFDMDSADNFCRHCGSDNRG